MFASLKNLLTKFTSKSAKWKFYNSWILESNLKEMVVFNGSTSIQYQQKHMYLQVKHANNGLNTKY